MGQYWMAVNPFRREYVDPSRFGGCKLWELAATWPGVGTALIILCAAQREVRGGGDFDMDGNWHGPNGPMPKEYSEIARSTIGRWAGDRIALVGDYAELDDLPPEFNADIIYDLCRPEEEVRKAIKHYRTLADKCRQDGNDACAEVYEDRARRLEEELEARGPYRDITDLVEQVMRHEFHLFYQDESQEGEDMTWRIFNVVRYLTHLLVGLGNARLCAGWILFILETLDTAWPEEPMTELLQAVRKGITRRLKTGAW